MGGAWGVLGGCLGGAWGLIGVCLGGAWGLIGVCLGCAWGVLGGCLGCAWAVTGGYPIRLFPVVRREIDEKADRVANGLVQARIFVHVAHELGPYGIPHQV